MNPAAILLYGALGGILLLALGALFAPIRWGVRLFVNACFGVFGLAIVGVFGTVAGLRISINLLTVALTALLGVPGLALVILLYILF
jgi:inhibitor of the pro-sigma K processing machinery